jgi:hypothetical protein
MKDESILVLPPLFFLDLIKVFFRATSGSFVDRFSFQQPLKISLVRLKVRIISNSFRLLSAFPLHPCSHACSHTLI